MRHAFENKFVCVWFDSLRPINNISFIKGRVFLGWTSTKLGLMFLLKDTMKWDSNPRPFGLESSTLPLSHCAPLRTSYTKSTYKTVFLLQLHARVRRLEQPSTILWETAAQYSIFVLVVHLQANWDVQMATFGAKLVKAVNHHVTANFNGIPRTIGEICQLHYNWNLYMD